MLYYGMVFELHRMLGYTFLAVALNVSRQFGSFPHGLFHEATGGRSVSRTSSLVREVFEGPSWGKDSGGKIQVCKSVDCL